MTEVTTTDGRKLACLEVGDPSGALVLHNHGGPSSRLEGLLLAEAASRHGIRLVAIDRPGFGQSSPQKARTFAGWAEDLTAVADALGCHEFGVLGWSEGGPWALAAAAYLDPARLRHVTNVAGGCYGTFGDDWAHPHMAPADAFGGTLAIRFRPGFRLMYGALELTAVHFRATYLDGILKAVNPYDQAILREVENDFINATVECFAHGSEGLVLDALCLYQKWAFDVGKITRPVHFWQGTDDRLVPPIINKTVAEGTPGAIWHEVAGAGHFVAVGSADAIFATAAAELR